MVGSDPPPPGTVAAPPEFANMVVAGVVTICSLQVAGFLSPAGNSSPASLAITLKNGAVLDNTGSWVEQPRGTIDIDGGHRSAFINDGTVTSIGGTMEVGAPVFGAGTALRIASTKGGDFHVTNVGPNLEITVPDPPSATMTALDPSVEAMMIPAMTS